MKNENCLANREGRKKGTERRRMEMERERNKEIKETIEKQPARIGNENATKTPRGRKIAGRGGE